MTLVTEASLKQDGTVWPYSAPDARGRPKVNAKTAIKCKLVKKSRNLLNPNGEIIVSDALLFVNTEVTKGSIFRLGTLVSVPATPNNLYEVMVYNEVNDITNRDTTRWVELNLWNVPLPTVE